MFPAWPLLVLSECSTAVSGSNPCLSGVLARPPVSLIYTRYGHGLCLVSSPGTGGFRRRPCYSDVKNPGRWVVVPLPGFFRCYALFGSSVLSRAISRARCSGSSGGDFAIA